MSKTITIMDKSYSQWGQNRVKRYRQCQIKAAIKVNEEHYSSIGCWGTTLWK